MRLATHRDSTFASPNSKAKACKAVKSKIEEELRKENVHEGNHTDNVVPAATQLVHEELQAFQNLVPSFN